MNLIFLKQVVTIKTVLLAEVRVYSKGILDMLSEALECVMMYGYIMYCSTVLKIRINLDTT